ncbi:Olfactory Receptor 52A5 [Manis pentadactyla]|nr:Olfactory Receptor 52A5 [Manis pentadactyla]
MQKSKAGPSDGFDLPCEMQKIAKLLPEYLFLFLKNGEINAILLNTCQLNECLFHELYAKANLTFVKSKEDALVPPFGKVNFVDGSDNIWVSLCAQVETIADKLNFLLHAITENFSA